jgi:hypothetical protein
VQSPPSPLLPFDDRSVGSAESNASQNVGSFESLPSPKSTPKSIFQFIDGSVLAICHDYDGLNTTSMSLDMATSVAQRFRAGRAAGAARATNAGLTTHDESNGQRSRTSMRSETLRHFQRMRVTSEPQPQGPQRRASMQESFEE